MTFSNGDVATTSPTPIPESQGAAEEIRTPDPLYAMPFRWVQVCSLGFMKSHIAKLLVHARSPQFASVQNICLRKR